MPGNLSTSSPSAARDRRTLLGLSLAPVIAAVLLAAIQAYQSDVDLECWMLPNSRVLQVPTLAECNITPGEAVRKFRALAPHEKTVATVGEALALTSPPSEIEVLVERDGTTSWKSLSLSPGPGFRRVAAAALIAALLMAIPTILLPRSTLPSVVPIVLMHSGTAVIIVAAIAGQRSELLTRLVVVILTLMPAVILHLGLTFPCPRRIFDEAPALAYYPYKLSTLFLAAGWLALDRNPLVWQTFADVVLALNVGAWITFTLACRIALKESKTYTERTRARVVFIGSVVVPILSSASLWATGASPNQLPAIYVATCAVVLPALIAISISRFDLFNLSSETRYWLGRATYASVASVVMATAAFSTGVTIGQSYSLTFATTLGCLLLLELARSRALGFLQGMFDPRSSELTPYQRRFEEQMAELRQTDDVADALCSFLTATIAPRSGVVFLCDEEGWRPASAFGRTPPSGLRLVEAARAVLDDAQFADERQLSDSLRDAGVELVLSLGMPSQAPGLVMLGEKERGDSYTRVEIDFLSTACNHCGIALQRAKLLEQRMQDERSRTTTQVALALAHDVNKEFWWLKWMAERLPRRIAVPDAICKDAEELIQFADEMAKRFSDFLRSSTDPAEAGTGSRLDEILEDALYKTSRLHPQATMTRHLDGAANRVRVPRHLVTVLRNIIENAILASEGGAPVRIEASLNAAVLTIEVVDQGIGMTPEVRHSALKEGFSTRSGSGGSGVGLSTASELVARMGGTLDITSERGSGTCVTISLPAGQA